MALTLDVYPAGTAQCACLRERQGVEVVRYKGGSSERERGIEGMLVGKWVGEERE